MATTAQTVGAPAFEWRRPANVFRHAPRALAWTIGLALAWAILRPPVTALAGMARPQPPGSEHLYLLGVGVGIAFDLVVYGFLSVFLARRERWAQVSLIAVSLVQAIYWGSQLARSAHGVAWVPANYPVNPPMLARDPMYALSAAIPLMTAVVAAWPSLWAWTRSDE